MASVVVSQNVNELIKSAKEIYVKEFGNTPDVTVYAPGRVNLIGEHTDYNDGFVLPMALPLVTVIVGTKIDGNESTIITTCDVPEPRKVTIEMPSKNALIKYCPKDDTKWSNYVKGVIVNHVGYVPSFRAVISSTVPIGGGLSSSASLEVSVYTFIDAITNVQAPPIDKALACQKAEHDYADVPCGIMDQFISVMGKRGNALLIDCRTLKSKLIPFNESNIKILITNSNVKHQLEGSEYSSRRYQCEQAALLIKKLSLRDATLQDVEYLKSINTEESIVKRARHVISEIDRTIKAAEALKDRNFNKFGELMVESHRSLRDDFDVSCHELDTLVELALQVDGVLGSRMTGGGFGGCTVTMVYNYGVDKLINHIRNNYKGNPTFYVCEPMDGATIVEN